MGSRRDFSDVVKDDFSVVGLVTSGVMRQRVPQWENARFAAPCQFNCPASIPSQDRFNLLRDGKVGEAYRLVLEYTPFPGSGCGSIEADAGRSQPRTRRIGPVHAHALSAARRWRLAATSRRRQQAMTPRRP